MARVANTQEARSNDLSAPSCPAPRCILYRGSWHGLTARTASLPLEACS
tara:strand:- start:62 stop:208 length:147 start_codon:yes stop_codon:yes gene_type:complete